MIYVVIIALVLLVAVGLAIVNFSYDEFTNIYEKYNDYNRGYLTSIDLINSYSRFIGKQIKIIPAKHKYGENYNPGLNTISLHSETIESCTTSALAVTAHELGHAKQWKEKKQDMKNYFKKIIYSKALGKLFFPSILIAIITFFIITSPLKWISFIIAGIAVLSFIVSLSLKLSTLKIEREASQFALEILENYAEFDDERLKEAKIVLKAAGNTYLADFLKSLLKWTFLTRK